MLTWKDRGAASPSLHPRFLLMKSFPLRGCSANELVAAICKWTLFILLPGWRIDNDLWFVVVGVLFWFWFCAP